MGENKIKYFEESIKCVEMVPIEAIDFDGSLRPWLVIEFFIGSE